MEEFIKMIVGDYEIIPEVYILVRLSIAFFIYNFVLDIITALKNIGKGVR